MLHICHNMFASGLAPAQKATNDGRPTAVNLKFSIPARRYLAQWLRLALMFICMCPSCCHGCVRPSAPLSLGQAGGRGPLLKWHQYGRITAASRRGFGSGQPSVRCDIFDTTNPAPVSPAPIIQISILARRSSHRSDMTRRETWYCGSKSFWRKRKSRMMSLRFVGRVPYVIGLYQLASLLRPTPACNLLLMKYDRLGERHMVQCGVKTFRPTNRLSPLQPRALPD